jgi:hypothetical protein
MNILKLGGLWVSLMVIRNPCRKCIVQACCNKECIKSESFRFSITVVGVASFIIGIVLSIAIPIFLWAQTDYSFMQKFLMTAGGWTSFMLILRLLAHFLDDDNDSWIILDYIIFFIFGPTLIFTGILILFYELFSRPSRSDSLFLLL